MSTTLERLTAPDALRDPQETTTAAMLPAGATHYLWAGVRICLGWTFLWPLLDKTFGLHNETASAAARERIRKSRGWREIPKLQRDDPVPSRKAAE